LVCIIGGIDSHKDRLPLAGSSGVAGAVRRQHGLERLGQVRLQVLQHHEDRSTR
jgi:hypothetical protein